MYENIICIVAGVLLFVICYATTFLGQQIDGMETKKSGGMPWFSQPGQATRISFVLIMLIFCAGGAAFINTTDIVIKIFGVVAMISAYMFAFTTMIFSMAAMNAIKNQPVTILPEKSSIIGKE